MTRSTATLTMSGEPVGVWNTREAAFAGIHQVLKTARHIVATQALTAKGRWAMVNTSPVTPSCLVVRQEMVGWAMEAPGFMVLTVTDRKPSRKTLKHLRAHMSATLAEAAYASGAQKGSSHIKGKIEIR